MSGVDRDIQCGNSFAKLYELGCFDEEFIVYGCGYYQNEEITYLISDDGEKLYRFRNEAILNHIYTTPIIVELVTCPVSSGERETIRQAIKFELAKKIKRLYCREYYETIASFDNAQANREAETFLQEEQRRLEGYFDKTTVEQFEGLCNLASEQKKISEVVYRQFCEWIKYAKKQMENDIIVKDDLRRVFYGFGYEHNDRVNYFADAQVMNIYKKREELLAQGAIVTPIISKEYWFKSINQLSKIRKEFMAHLKDCIDHGFLEKTKRVYDLKNPIDRKMLQVKSKSQLSNIETEAIKLYLCRIGVKIDNFI